jgi:hypothetical protein
MVSEETTEERQPDEERKRKKHRKEFRFSDTQYDHLRLLMERTDIEDETEAVGYALATVVKYLPLVTSARMPDRDMLKEIQGVAGVLLAFFGEAERALREESADEEAVRALGTEVLQALQDPFLLGQVFAEAIGERPIWLRFSWMAPHLYREAEDCLERALEYVSRDRYSPTPARHRGEEDDEDEENEGEEVAGEPPVEGTWDPETDYDYPSIRLSYPDIYALYEEFIVYLNDEEQAAFFAGLQRALKTTLPHLGKRRGEKRA